MHKQCVPGALCPPPPRLGTRLVSVVPTLHDGHKKARGEGSIHFVLQLKQPCTCLLGLKTFEYYFQHRLKLKIVPFSLNWLHPEKFTPVVLNHTTGEVETIHLGTDIFSPIAQPATQENNDRCITN